MADTPITPPVPPITPPVPPVTPGPPPAPAAVKLPPITPRKPPVAPLRKTPPSPPKAARVPNTDGKHFSYAGAPDLTADHITAVNASNLPDDVKALIAGRLTARNHKIAKADVHVFEDSKSLTIHATILKVV